MKKIFALVCMVTLSVVAYANFEPAIHLKINSSPDSVITVSIENDTIGVLRKPSEIDKCFYLFTEAKYIRIALNEYAKKMNFKYKPGFHGIIEKGKFKKANKGHNEIGSNIQKREAAYISKDSLRDRTFILNNVTRGEDLIFYLSPYNIWNLQKLELEIYRKKDTIKSSITDIESELKTKVFASGDTISLKVRNDQIGSRIIGVSANEEQLKGYFKYRKENENYSEDDIAIKPTAFFTDKFVLPTVEDSTNFTIKVQYEYISNCRLVSGEKDVTIIVVPKIEEKSNTNILEVILIIFIIIAILLSCVYGRKFNKIVKEEAKKKSKDEKLANNKGKNKSSASPIPKQEEKSSNGVEEKIDNQDEKSKNDKKTVAKEPQIGVNPGTQEARDVKNNELEKNKELLERISNLEKENESVRNQLQVKEEQLLQEREDFKIKIQEKNREVISVLQDKKQLNTTIEQIEKEKLQVSERVEKQKKEIDGLKKDIESKDIHIKEKNKTIQAKQDLINTLQTEKEVLTKRISEELLVERDKFANSLMQKQNAIKDLIQTMFNEIVEDENSIYYNRVKRINKDFSRFIDRINSLNIQESQISIKEIKKSVQDCVIPSMLEDGWINTIYVVNEYMKASNNLYNEFSIIGVSGVLLHKLIASINEYLGMVGIKVLLPYLMVEDFNREEYEYEEERWIHRFDTNISEQFVSDKIVDISRIGYQIEGQEIVKPKVNYTF